MTDLLGLIQRASYEERQNLCKIFGCKLDSKTIFKSFQLHSQNKILSLFAKDKTYYTLLKEVASRCKVMYSDGESENDIEQKLLVKVLKDITSKMTDEQKSEFEKNIKDEYKKNNRDYHWVGSAAWVAGILGAQASGFGIYLLSSILLSTVSRALGLSLGFAAYAGASSAIAVLIGPAGWALAAVFAVWTLASPNSKKLLVGILQIIAIKSRMGYEGEGEI